MSKQSVDYANGMKCSHMGKKVSDMGTHELVEFIGQLDYVIQSKISDNEKMKPRMITIKPIQLFQLSFNGAILGDFTVVSSWEGMIKLRGELGTVVIECRESFVERLFDFEGKFGDQKTEDFAIVSASPSILAKIMI